MLRKAIRASLTRARLSSLMSFCSANSIGPEGVSEAVMQQFLNYHSRCGKPATSAFRRLLARAWNENVGKVPGWPAQRLSEPPVKSAVEIAWETFPAGLRREIDDYLEGLTRIRKSRTGQRIRPLKPIT